MGKQLRSRLRDVGESLLEHFGDPGVQLLALGLEQRLVGGVLNQGVLEAVGRLGRHAAAEHQLRSHPLIEGPAQLVTGQR
jgi:hypothetical protein